MSVAPYPLSWPENLPRWRGTREKGAFKTTLAQAMENVQGSLRRFGADSGQKVGAVTISSNVTLGVNSPADPGVAVWFTWDDLSVCIAVDRYNSVMANLQAIHHVLEARRTELRHGTLALTRSAMTGLRALPPPEPWWKTLGLDAEPAHTGPASAALVERLFREAARKAHPDMGGSDAKMAEVNRARQKGLEWAMA